MYIRLQYNQSSGLWFLPTATDDTVPRLQDTDPIVEQFQVIKDQNILHCYTGLVYSLASNVDPFAIRPWCPPVSYWIKQE